MKTLALLLLVASTMQVVVSTSPGGELSFPAHASSLLAGVSLTCTVVDAEPKSWWTRRRRGVPANNGPDDHDKGRWNTHQCLIKQEEMAGKSIWPILQSWTDFSVDQLRVVWRRVLFSSFSFSSTFPFFLTINVVVYHTVSSKTTSVNDNSTTLAKKIETTTRTWLRRVICRACTRLCLACVPVSIFLARVVDPVSGFFYFVCGCRFVSLLSASSLKTFVSSSYFCLGKHKTTVSSCCERSKERGFY